MKYKINDKLNVQKIGKKTTIFDEKNAVLYTLNETAGLIFNKIKSKWDEKKIVKMMMNKYNVSEEKTKNDYRNIILFLIKKKILNALPRVTRLSGATSGGGTASTSRK